MGKTCMDIGTVYVSDIFEHAIIYVWLWCVPNKFEDVRLPGEGPKSVTESANNMSFLKAPLII